MCFVDLEKAFNRIQMKVFEWAIRKKEVLIKSVMGLLERAKARVAVNSQMLM